MVILFLFYFTGRCYCQYNVAETKIDSDLEKTHPLHHIIRMRNIHQHIKAEYGMAMLDCFSNGKNWNARWGISKTIEDSHLDALELTLYL